MRRIITITAALTLAGTSAAVVAAASPGAPPIPADNDHARGLVFDGLRAAGSGGPCAGGFEIEVAEEVVCTHGPDAAEDGIDVRSPRSVAELRLSTLSLPTVAGGGLARAQEAHHDADQADHAVHVHADGSEHDHGFAAAAGDGSATAAETGIIPVIGDGVSGNRVQAVYVVAADRPDRFDEIAPLIANWAAHMDAMLDASAALTGGERHIRFVTNPDGTLNVQRVVLPAEGDDTFGNTIVAMKNAGYNDSSRKYLMWTDASLYCGVGTIYGDDKPTEDNYNNGVFAMYSRVDTGCWGKSNSVELHEIVHNMGGVQKSAPNVTPGWHCNDDYDRMCYRDAAEVVMTYNCPTWMEAYLDCGHDDYFNTSPEPGSYLDQHWNVADSSFLHAGPVGGDPPPPPVVNEAPMVSVTAPPTAEIGVAIALDGTVTDDGHPGPYSVAWSVLSGPSGASFADATAEDTFVTFSTAGDYQIVLAADDGELTGLASVTVSVTDPAPPPPPLNEAPTVSVSASPTAEVGTPVALNGSVVDDGVPGPYSVSWSVLSGPSGASIADATAEDTSVTFAAAGTYQLGLTADDGDLSGSASVSISVSDPAPPPPPPPGPNVAPTVSVTGPASIVLGDDALVNGSVSDDGQPGPYSVAWMQASGPAPVTFGDAGAEDTLVGFSAAGAYELVLTADDGELIGSASLWVVVEAPPPPTETTEIFTGSLNKKWNSRSFTVDVGAGELRTTLTGGDTGGRGKNRTAAATEFTVSVIDGIGGVVATFTGAGPFDVLADVAAGRYVLEVSGAPSSFELSVTYITPT